MVREGKPNPSPAPAAAPPRVAPPPLRSMVRDGKPNPSPAPAAAPPRVAPPPLRSMVRDGKPKPSPAPAAAPPPPAAAIEDLFTALHDHIDLLGTGANVDDKVAEKIVKLADQVLEAAPGDGDAILCKVVALVKGERFGRALSAIEAAQGVPVDLRFYKAYCIYRQNKPHEALKLLDGLERDAAVLKLESMIFYRLLRMDAAIESYDKLKKFKIDSLELKANIIATLISAGKAAEVQGTMDALKVKPSSSFELAYNTACSFIELNKYADAEKHLLFARRIGQEQLMEEELEADEIETELAPIAVQLAHVQQLLGHTQEAIEAYTGILNRKGAVDSTFAVATNNLIALKSTKDTSDSLRKLDRLTTKDGSTSHFQLSNVLDIKLFPRQKEALYCNHVLLLLQANKIDQAQELVYELPKLFPDSVAPVLLQAAVLVRQKRVTKAEEILGQFADKFPEKSKPVLLARAQIAAAAGHLQISAESLSNAHDIQHTPAIVATIVALRERSGEIDSAAATLDDAIQWWKNAMTEQSKLDLFIKEAASFKLNHGCNEEALQLYEELVKQHNSVEALAGVVTTVAHTDIEKADVYEKQLRPLPGLKGINVESLEKTSGAKPMEGVKNAKAEVSEEVKKSKAKKRKRKPRYPKGFDPANPGAPADPERWLPKRERSTYRPKRKDKRVQVRGSQGSVGRDKHDAASTSNTASSSGVTGTKAGHANAGSSKGAAQTAMSSKPRKKSRG